MTEEYEVEKIISQRSQNDLIEYRVRWKNYGPEHDTWEPENNLVGCEEVLVEYKINNNIPLHELKKDYEDGEVSETDSSILSDSSLKKYKKSKKKGKKKKSHKKIIKEENSDNDSEAGLDNMGIKIEVPTSQPERSKPVSIQLDLTMGASSMLLTGQCSYDYGMSNSYNCDEQNNSKVKEESASIVKEEMWSNREDNSNLAPMQAPMNEDSDEENAEKDYNGDEDDSDVDLDSQLRVDIGEDYDINKKTDSDQLNSSSIEASCMVENFESLQTEESDKAKQWREHLESGTFKIKKTQRKEDLLKSHQINSVLAKEKWPTKPKDTIAEAFYNLPVYQSVVDASYKTEMDMENDAIEYEPTKDQIYSAIELGSSSQVWKWFAKFKNVLLDGEFLLLAARVGFVDIALMILRAGSNVNYKNEEGTTPLMFACEYGHELMCNLLINHGAHLNLINNNEESAISKAVTRGHKECLLVLIQHGCDVFTLENEKDPYMLAKSRNMREIESLIYDYHNGYSDKVLESFLTMLDNTVTVNYAIFPLRIVSLFEDNEFTFNFTAKIPPVRDDECNLFVALSAVVSGKQLTFCLDPDNSLKSVTLNDLEQHSLFPSGSLAITSLAPIIDGNNILQITCSSPSNCRWVRLMIVGYRIKLTPSDSPKSK